MHLPSLTQEHTLNNPFKKCIPGKVVNSICDNLTNHPMAVSSKMLIMPDNQLVNSDLLPSIHQPYDIHKVLSTAQ